MEIIYDNSREVQYYRNFVENPEDRKAIKDFMRVFGKELMSSAKKLHDRLKSYESVGAYNKVYISNKNRIEIKEGERDNSPLILKARINESYRKFFNSVSDEEDVLLNREWKGEFDSVIRIKVIEINKHKYDF